MDRSDEQQENFLSGNAPEEENDIMVSSEDGADQYDAGDDGLPGYEKKESNVMRYVLFGLLAILAVAMGAFFMAGDQIVSMMNGGNQTRITPMALKQQPGELQPATTGVNDNVSSQQADMPLGMPPAVEDDTMPVVSDGSFTDIDDADETNMPASADNNELSNIIEGNQAQPTATQPEIPVMPEGVMPTETEDMSTEANDAAMPDTPLAPPADQEFDQQAILDEVLDEDDVLRPTQPMEMDPVLEDIIAGRNIPQDQSQGGYDSRSAADRVQETITVYPRVKKMIIVEKNYSSSSDRSLADAAARALRGGQYAAAVEHYNALLQTDPGNISAKMGKALALQRTGKSEQALEVYGDVLATDPNNVNALTNYFGIVSKIDPRTAAQELEVLHRDHPGNAEIAGQLGVVYGQLQDPVKAVVYFEKAASLAPENPLYVYNMAVLADRMGSTGKAISYYEKTIDLLNEQSRPSISKASIFQRLRELRVQ